MTGCEKGRADLILVKRGLVTSREKARALIRKKAVRLNGELLVKPSQTIASDGKFHIEQASIRWVSRGGLKLDATLNAFDVPDLSGAGLISLIKPQFEAGRPALGKGGVVRQEADR